MGAQKSDSVDHSYRSENGLKINIEVIQRNKLNWEKTKQKISKYIEIHWEIAQLYEIYYRMLKN